MGQYALTFLDAAAADPSYRDSYKTNVLKNVVSYETDVKSVLSKVALGEADAGIVYTTDAATKTGKIGTVAIPDTLNTIALLSHRRRQGHETGGYRAGFPPLCRHV